MHNEVECLKDFLTEVPRSLEGTGFPSLTVRCDVTFKGMQSQVTRPGIEPRFPALHLVQSGMEVARDVRKRSDYKRASAPPLLPPQPPLSFLLERGKD